MTALLLLCALSAFAFSLRKRAWIAAGVVGFVAVAPAAGRLASSAFGTCTSTPCVMGALGAGLMVGFVVAAGAVALCTGLAVGNKVARRQDPRLAEAGFVPASATDRMLRAEELHAKWQHASVSEVSWKD